MQRTIGDSFLSRRDALKLGGYGLLGAFADQALWPLAARAAGKQQQPISRAPTVPRAVERDAPHRHRALPKESRGSAFSRTILYASGPSAQSSTGPGDPVHRIGDLV